MFGYGCFAGLLISFWLWQETFIRLLTLTLQCLKRRAVWTWRQGRVSRGKLLGRWAPNEFSRCNCRDEPLYPWSKLSIGMLYGLVKCLQVLLLTMQRFIWFLPGLQERRLWHGMWDIQALQVQVYRFCGAGKVKTALLDIIPCHHWSCASKPRTPWTLRFSLNLQLWFPPPTGLQKPVSTWPALRSCWPDDFCLKSQICLLWSFGWCWVLTKIRDSLWMTFFYFAWPFLCLRLTLVQCAFSCFFPTCPVPGDHRMTPQTWVQYFNHIFMIDVWKMFGQRANLHQFMFMKMGVGPKVILRFSLHSGKLY